MATTLQKIKPALHAHLHRKNAATTVLTVKDFDCINALRALGEENRLRILHLLMERERSVTDLAEALELTTYNASKHLRVLKDASLVSCEKQGQQRFYSIADDLQQHLRRNKNTLDLGCCLFRFDELDRSLNQTTT